MSLASQDGYKRMTVKEVSKIDSPWATRLMANPATRRGEPAQSIARIETVDLDVE